MAGGGSVCHLRPPFPPRPARVESRRPHCPSYPLRLISHPHRTDAAIETWVRQGGPVEVVDLVRCERNDVLQPINHFRRRESRLVARARPARSEPRSKGRVLLPLRLRVLLPVKLVLLPAAVSHLVDQSPPCHTRRATKPSQITLAHLLSSYKCSAATHHEHTSTKHSHPSHSASKWHGQIQERAPMNR